MAKLRKVTMMCFMLRKSEWCRTCRSCRLDVYNSLPRPSQQALLESAAFTARSSIFQFLVLNFYVFSLSEGFPHVEC